MTLGSDQYGTLVDWTSSAPIDAVIVKGGPNANAYVYAGESSGDTGLHAPFNGPDKYYGLSHVDFCWDDETPAGRRRRRRPATTRRPAARRHAAAPADAPAPRRATAGAAAARRPGRDVLGEEIRSACRACAARPAAPAARSRRRSAAARSPRW